MFYRFPSVREYASIGEKKTQGYIFYRRKERINIYNIKEEQA
jgi:hypothetical protein